MERQAIMGTDVLHEQTFVVKGRFPPRAGLDVVCRDGIV